MNFLPTPPTDNLYKFMAISGIWMIISLLIFIFANEYWKYQSDVETKHIQLYYNSKQLKKEISERIEAIKNGQFSENKLEWIPKDYTPEHEINILTTALSNHEKTIERYSKEADDIFYRDKDFFDYLGQKWTTLFLTIYLITGYLFCVLGFLNWYKNIQKPMETINNLDIKIRELTAKKLEDEILDSKKWKPRSSTRT